MKLKSLISKALILGLTLNNSLLSTAETLLGIEQYETFNGNYITINNILEESSVNVKIEGNTMHNLVKNNNKWILSNDNLIAYKYIDASLLKPNTEYTVVFSGDLSKVSHSAVTLKNVTENNNEVIGESESLKYKITTNSLIHNGEGESVGIVPHIYYREEYPFTEGYINNLNLNIMVFEGDWTQLDTPTEYFEGIQSVGQNGDSNKLEIISSNRNLIDWSNVTTLGGVINETSSEIHTSGKNNIGGGIEINLYNMQKGDYYFGATCKTSIPEDGSIRVFNQTKYKYEKLFLAGVPTELEWKGGFFSLTEDVPHLKIWIGKSNYYDTETEFVIKKDLLLQRISDMDNIPVTIPKESNEIEILLNEPLRAIGDIKDKIVKKDGKWQIERNIGEIILSDSNVGNGFITGDDGAKGVVVKVPNKIYQTTKAINDKFNQNNQGISLKNVGNFYENPANLVFVFNPDVSIEDARSQIIGSKMVYKYETPIYESINSLILNTYLETTNISNNSIIPCNIEITLDRTINRAVEAIELAKINPTTENLSKARMWVNLLDDSIKKDELQSEINTITNLDDMVLERKSATANLDIYVKCENMLSMSLSTNNITFDNYSGVEDMEKPDAIEISINSSLPYDLNAYLQTEIKGSENSNIMDMDILKIKDSSKDNYQSFANTTDKITLNEDCASGNYISHNIDLKLESNNAYSVDVYKTTIKFEAVQK